MIEWILQRPAHASNPSEIRVAERLKALGESPFAWTVVFLSCRSAAPGSPSAPAFRSQPGTRLTGSVPFLAILLPLRP